MFHIEVELVFVWAGLRGWNVKVSVQIYPRGEYNCDICKIHTFASTAVAQWLGERFRRECSELYHIELGWYWCIIQELLETAYHSVDGKLSLVSKPWDAALANVCFVVKCRWKIPDVALLWKEDRCWSCISWAMPRPNLTDLVIARENR